MSSQASLLEAINAELASRKEGSRDLQSAIDAELNSRSAVGARPEEPSWSRTLKGYMNEILQGQAFGFADEIGASQASTPYSPFFGGLLGSGVRQQQLEAGAELPTYEQAREALVRPQEKFREENDITSVIAQAVGASVNPMGLANTVRGQVAKRLPGTDAVSRVARALPMPAAAGTTAAAVGVGEGEPGKRTDNIARDFAIGAGLQGGLQLAAPAARRFTGKMADVALPLLQRFYQKFTTPQDSAAGLMRMLASASDEFKFSKEQIASLQNRLMRGSGPTVAAAEDDSLLQLARYARERGAGKELQVELNKLARGSGERLRRFIQNDLLRGNEGGIRAAGNVRNYILKSRSEVGSAQYQRAFNTQLENTPELKNVLKQVRTQEPAVIREIERLGNNALFAETGKPSNFKIGRNVNLSMQGWHAVAKALGEMGAPGNKGASAYRDMRKRILNELDSQSLEYKTARAHWRGSKEAEELIDFGRDIARGMDPTKVAQRARELQSKHGRSLDFKTNPMDRELVVLGLSEGLEQSVINKSGAAIPEGAQLIGRSGPGTAQSVFDKASVEQNIRLILGDKGTDEVYEHVVREMNIKHAANTLNHAAGTSKQQALKDTIEGSTIGLIPDALKKALVGADPKTLSAVEQMIMSVDPKDQQRLIDVLSGEAWTETLRRGVGNNIGNVLANPFAIGTGTARVNENLRAPEE